MGRIIIFGNKVLQSNLSNNEIDFINSSDLIFRVNHMNNLSQTGNRVDGMWLEANFNFLKKCSEEHKDFIQQCGIIYCPEGHKKRLSKVITDLNDKEVNIISDNFLKKINCSNNCVSTIRLAYCLLNDERYLDFDIYILGFDKDRSLSPQYKIHYHKPKIDQEYLDKLLLNKRIHFIEHD